MKATYNTYKSENVKCGKVKDLTSKRKKNIKYKSIPINYLYADGDKEVLSEFSMEFPPCKAFPPSYSEEYEKWTMRIVLDTSEKMQKIASENFQDVICVAATSVLDNGFKTKKWHKKGVKVSAARANKILSKGSKEEPIIRVSDSSDEHTFFVNVMFYSPKGKKKPHPDKVTGKAAFAKISKRHDGSIRRKILKWGELENKELRIIPLIKFKSIYKGSGKPSLQFMLTSALVLSMKDVSSIDKQISTNPEEASKTFSEYGLELDEQDSDSDSDSGSDDGGPDTTREDSDSESTDSEEVN